MKTVKNKDVIKRVKDDVAAIMVLEQGWQYISKSEWKKISRNVKDEKTESVPKNKEQNKTKVKHKK